MPRVVVAMSGGVDSSVTAALLKRDGFEVIGMTMQFWDCDGSGNEFDGCCGFRGVSDARRVAEVLGIPHYVVNFKDVFAEKVIADFCAEYSRGRTPNPCVRCNQFIKFGPFLERARALGADFIATGHYARIEKEGERYLLKKGIDLRKDQSYALCMLAQDQLRLTLMPLGKYTKEKVRQIARDMALPVAEKAESQEICFVPDNDYRGFVRSRVPEMAKPGPILDQAGKVIGEHQGIINYTIGQRRGMGIAAEHPLYVIAIDPERNAVIIGPQSAAYAMELVAAEVNWVALDGLSQPLRVQAKVRYLHKEAPAMVTPLDGGRVRVRFEEPQMAITPGQFVVFYDCNLVFGGGVIEKVENHWN